ncbi:hypothetical protein VTP01DRAFT_7082 [Rhizomucor pusillus]|uniref:uncharacterized protein n=1 Tax=Rhizomucor pusillus TaxID=4840 RepID=UPI0037426614
MDRCQSPSSATWPVCPTVTTVCLSEANPFHAYQIHEGVLCSDYNDIVIGPAFQQETKNVQILGEDWMQMIYYH